MNCWPSKNFSSSHTKEDARIVKPGNLSLSTAENSSQRGDKCMIPEAASANAGDHCKGESDCGTITAIQDVHLMQPEVG